MTVPNQSVSTKESAVPAPTLTATSSPLEDEVSVPPAQGEPSVPLIEMTEGLPGYPGSRTFVLERLDEAGSLSALRATDPDGPDFLVVPPALWFPSYEPELDDETCAALSLEAPEDVLLLLVVTMGEKPQDATANLLAPLVVNTRTQQGSQAVLAGTAYSVRQPLFAS